MLVRDEVRELKRLFPEAKTVLDVGTGDGAFLEQLWKAGFHSLGIEKDVDRVRVAPFSANKHILIEEFPSPSLGKFDIVTFRESIYYIDPKEVMEAVNRILLVGGGLYIKAHVETSLYYWRHTRPGDLFLKRFKEGVKWFPNLQNVTSIVTAYGYEILSKGYFADNIFRVLDLPFADTLLGWWSGRSLSLIVNTLGYGDRCYLFARRVR